MNEVHVGNNIDNIKDNLFCGDKLKALKFFYDCLVDNYDFDYSSIYPFENVPLILANEVLDFGYGNSSDLLPVMRKEIGMETFSRDDYLYNTILNKRKDRFDYAKWKAHEYEANLRKIGVTNFKSYDDINSHILAKQKQNLLDSNPKHEVINTIDIANKFKKVCDKLDIPCEIISGSVMTKYGNQENIAWNTIYYNDKLIHIDLTSALMNKSAKDAYFNKSTEEFCNDKNRKIKTDINVCQSILDDKVKKLVLN